MLLRMYLRWAERSRYRTEILEATEGEEAGLKSVTFQISGRWAYGRMKSERGVHRLVRISPYDSQNRRHTSFALVEVMPEVPEDAQVEIDEKDLRVDTYRSSGAGGQHVNKTDSAVRITHLPTKIVVAVQNERSQHQNREKAMAVLRAKLVERQEEEREAELLRLRGKHVEAGWGNQIRSYVLQPYTMVKDLRTGVETANPSAVLDGELDPFIDGYLRSRIGEEHETAS
jgi:peptide chain release factor 2